MKFFGLTSLGGILPVLRISTDWGCDSSSIFGAKLPVSLEGSII